MTPLLTGVLALSASAAIVPFTEDFAADAAGWRDSVSVLLSWSSNGGPDGSSFAFGAFNFVNSTPGATPVLLRAQDEFGSSGGAFEGDWIADGVDSFSAYVKHDAEVALTFFTRFASSVNFPGAVALDFEPVQPDTWTLLEFAISPDSPQFISFEGSDFETIFSDIAHVQLGVSVPVELAGVDAAHTFSLDKPTIVPEPASVGLAAIVLLFLRRRSWAGGIEKIQTPS